MNPRRKTSKVFRWSIQVDNSRCRCRWRWSPSTQDLSGAMWGGLHKLQRLQQRQVRRIKVWKVCSAYLWHESVPGDVNAAHHTSSALHGPSRPRGGSTSKPEARVSSAHTQGAWTHCACHRWGQAWLLLICTLCYWCRLEKSWNIMLCFSVWMMIK